MIVPRNFIGVKRTLVIPILIVLASPTRALFGTRMGLAVVHLIARHVFAWRKTIFFTNLVLIYKKYQYISVGFFFIGLVLLDRQCFLAPHHPQMIAKRI